MTEFQDEFAVSKFSNLSTETWDFQVEQPVWMLDKLIPARSIGMLFGPSNSGKSHLICDLAINCAAGSPNWLGHGLSTGDVVLFSESHGHIKTRLKAYRDWHGRNMAHGIITHPTMSLDTREIADLQTWLYTLRSPPMMLVFDTLATSFSLEENDNKEASKLIKELEDLVLPAMHEDGCIVIVHHTSKASEGRSARGASALTANLDWSINVQWDKDLEMTVAKWDKDRWRLIDESPTWAGRGRKQSVQFIDGHTDVVILDWMLHTQEQQDAIERQVKDSQNDEYKRITRAALKAASRPVFIRTSKGNKPKDGQVFAIPKAIPNSKHQVLKDWIASEYETKIYVDSRGNEVGFYVVVDDDSL